MINIAVFASGSGSNAERLINYFKDSELINIKLIICNNPAAFVLERAKNHNVKSVLVNKKQFQQADEMLALLKEDEIDFIVLAGFLWLIPAYLIDTYPNRIVNIHPALLPAYGGKGMYGMHVHQAVINNKEKESGITIHVVNQHYDEGTTIFQASCSLNETDTPESLAEKIHQLEYQHFPVVLRDYILQLQLKNK